MSKATDFLTASQLFDLESEGRSFHIYPRKHLVCVDGFRWFKVSQSAVNKWKYYKKNGVLIR